MVQTISTSSMNEAADSKLHCITNETIYQYSSVSKKYYRVKNCFGVRDIKMDDSIWFSQQGTKTLQKNLT